MSGAAFARWAFPLGPALQARADGYARRWRADKPDRPGWSTWTGMHPCDDECERPCRLAPLADADRPEGVP